MNNTKIGDRVVCIKGSRWNQLRGAPYTGPLPEVGEVYTIDSFTDFDNKIFIHLEEFSSPAQFQMSGFRHVPRIDFRAKMKEPARV